MILLDDDITQLRHFASPAEAKCLSRAESLRLYQPLQRSVAESALISGGDMSLRDTSGFMTGMFILRQ